MKTLTFIIIVFFVSLIGKAQYNKDIIIESILKTDTTAIGQKIIYPNFAENEVTLLKITIPPGKSTGWHKHEFPVFAYILHGVLTVEIENYKTMQYSENSSFSEVINSLHNGKNSGNEDVVLIAFFMGEKGKPLSTHQATNTEEFINH